ncbi:MAG: hypothetical protein K2N51_08085 [Lachnospiraceae bacterium]|nr:hypothetical protein [Lachnospiraceae bacterium]
MNKHKLEQDEIKEIAHFLTKRSITTSPGQPITALTEYLETYNNLINKMEEYNKTID